MLKNRVEASVEEVRVRVWYCNTRKRKRLNDLRSIVVTVIAIIVAGRRRPCVICKFAVASKNSNSTFLDLGRVSDLNI